MTDPVVQNKLLIFLSHAREDKKQVRNLCKRLREDGFDPWLDEERLLPGQDWDLEIENAMRLSDAILLCFSKLSVAKEGYVQREYKRADSYAEEKPEGTIYTIPIRLDDCEIPHFIRDKQWVDYPDSYDRLVMALNIRAGGSPMPAKPTKPKAKKPTSKGDSNKPGGGNTFNINGGIKAGRDVVMGNQTKTVYQSTHTTNLVSLEQFREELRKLREEIEQLKSQPDVGKADALRIEVAQAEIDSAMEEAAKEAPAAERIKKTLDGAKETMDKLGGSVASAINLGTALGNLAMMAAKLFGG